MSKLTLYSMVCTVLEKYPQARDSDQRLTLGVWATFYSDKLWRDRNGDLCVRLTDALKLPREDTVSRWRRKIQHEEKRFLPTNLNVLRSRKIMQTQRKEELGYSWKE